MELEETILSEATKEKHGMYSFISGYSYKSKDNWTTKYRFRVAK